MRVPHAATTTRKKNEKRYCATAQYLFFYLRKPLREWGASYCSAGEVPKYSLYAR